MNKYTVEEVAKKLDRNPETIRRWIRNGKLKATKHSRKKGFTISEDELDTFKINYMDSSRRNAKFAETPKETFWVICNGKRFNLATLNELDKNKVLAMINYWA